MAKFFQTGQQQLRSTSMWSQHSDDRPAFQADVQRGLFRSGHFQIFAMPQGLLFLEMRLKDYGALGGGASGGGMVLAMQFGALGGLAAGMAAARDAERYGSRPADRWEAGFELKSDDELFELARQRRKSFVAKHDEIRSVVINPPGLSDRIFGDGSLAGSITLRARGLGKIFIDFRDQTDLAVAVDALPRHLGDRVQVNVAFDESTRRFVRRR
jgi:hypothetical protein